MQKIHHRIINPVSTPTSKNTNHIVQQFQQHTKYKIQIRVQKRMHGKKPTQKLNNSNRCNSLHPTDMQNRIKKTPKDLNQQGEPSASISNRK